MVMGHYVTALIPYAKTREESIAPFWLFLLASQFLDILMLLLVTLGIESFEVDNPLIPKFVEMQTDMFVSHDVIPVLMWSVIFAGFAFLISKNRIVAAWCFGLVVFHECLDLIVGFHHRIYDQRLVGVDSSLIGLGLYSQAPLIGILIEIIFCAAVLFWFFQLRSQQKKPVSNRMRYGLLAILVGGTLGSLPNAI